MNNIYKISLTMLMQNRILFAMVTMTIIAIIAIGMLSMFDRSEKEHFENDAKSNATVTNITSIFTPEQLASLARDIVNYDTLGEYTLLNNVVFDTPSNQSKASMTKQIDSIASSIGASMWKTIVSQQWIIFSEKENFEGRKFFIYPSNGSFTSESKFLEMLNIFNGKAFSFYIPANCEVKLRYQGRMYDPAKMQSEQVIDIKNEGERKKLIESISEKTETLTGRNDSYHNNDLMNIMSMEISVLQA